MHCSIHPAVSALSTCRYWLGAPVRVTVPVAVTMFFTSHGFTICPPLAMLDVIMFMCIGVSSTVDLKTAFAKSCNVTFGKLAYQLGNERMLETAKKLGFNENFKLGDFAIYNSKFPTEAENVSGLVWSGVGQSTVLITPMHMNMITASVANGGQMVKPWLVKNIVTGTGTITKTGAPSQYRQVMSADTANLIAKCMYYAVEKGTATRAKIDGYTVCGKTGSAETSDDKSVETNSWYTGFIADGAHPYVVSVVIERGGAGGKKATELAAKVLRAAVEYVG